MMLEIKNLHASVDGNEILRGIDLTDRPLDRVHRPPPPALA